jgi:carbonic anhydrase
VHVQHTIDSILEHSPTLAAMLAANQIGIIGAMYDVSSGRVTFLPATARGVTVPTAARGVLA